MSSKEYTQYMASSAWRQKSAFVKQQAKERCFVCGHDWKARKGRYLTVHHTRYRDKSGKSILGKEGPKDLVPLCDRHHVRGRCGWDTLRLMRLYYLVTKFALWLLWIPLRLLWLFWRGSLWLLSPPRGN